VTLVILIVKVGTIRN